MMANLQTKKETLQRQTTEITEQLKACAAKKSKIDNQWQALWAPCQIRPRTPREMRAWMDDLEKLRDQAEQFTLLCQRAGELEQTRKTHIQLLNQQLVELGKDGSKTELLEPLLLKCEHLEQQIDKTKQKRDGLKKEIRALEISLQSSHGDHRVATEKLAAWKVQWKALLESFGVQGDTSPTQVAEFIEKVRELVAKQGDAKKLQLRIKVIDDYAESLRSEVGAIVENIAPELADLPAADAVMRLNSLLSENRARQAQRQQIEKSLEQAKQEIQDSESIIQTMTDRLNSLCTEAQCGNRAELEAAEQRFAQHLEIKNTIDSIGQEIQEAGEGATVAELEKEVEGVDPDVLPARIGELNNKIDEELEPNRTNLAETKGREEKELELMDGSDHAASLADQAQAVLAGIRSDAERYVRVKLAGRVLRDEVERYRKENQGPLVKRASEHFAALTLGSFEGLNTDVNDKDEPVLAGLRPDGERVYVEGMSSGTRDQLYLALRLASLEKYMDSAEPMPFIVDDVLVDFDDMRSEAALTALSVLAEKTQVILFTHHSQLVEQAKNLKRSVYVHEL